jgi:U6 snRNA-associated Sm-like protein LSm4
MNLRDVICTSKDGDRFWKLPSCYIRGSAVKYLRLPPELLEKAKVASAQEQHFHTPRGASGRGRDGGRDGGGRSRGGRSRGGRGRGGRGRSGGRGRDGTAGRYSRS